MSIILSRLHGLVPPIAALWLVAPTFILPAHAQESILNNDSDGDLIVDTVDIDDDNDGIPDVLEISVTGQDIDSDKDGLPDRLDLDSDNDGLLDWQESGALFSIDFSGFDTSTGRISAPVGLNGYANALETGSDNGQMRFTLANTDFPADDFPDFIDLDSDNDGRPDLYEAGLNNSLDSDRDARIDIDVASGSGVGTDGIADRVQVLNDRSCCDFNGDGVIDFTPVNTDVSDLPDFQDLDSDNDGKSDLIELGGVDADNDGRVDNFSDTVVVDGLDDSHKSVPLNGVDNNGNGVMDHLDAFVQVGSEVSNNDGLLGNKVLDPNSGGSENALQDGDSAVPADEVEPTTGTRDPAARPGANILSPADDKPAADDPTNGLVETGLNASGCSANGSGSDWLLLLLAVFCIATLGLRYTRRRSER